MDKKYVAAAGSCPVCNGDDLDYGSMEVEGNQVFYPWTCCFCGATGKEWHTLHFSEHTDVVVKGDKEDEA